MSDISMNTSNIPRLLRVFLCHASEDKPAVRELYELLCAEGIDAWLDEEKLMPGLKWPPEISKAIRDSDAVIICLSRVSVGKEGYVQKEIKFVVDMADEKPEGAIFLIPARLDECKVPAGLASWQRVDLFAGKYEQLVRALRARADTIGPAVSPPRRRRKGSLRHVERIKLFQQHLRARNKTPSLPDAIEASEAGQITRQQYRCSQQWHSWYKWTQLRNETGWQELMVIVRKGERLSTAVRTAASMELRRVRQRAYTTGKQSAKDKEYERRLRFLLAVKPGKRSRRRHRESRRGGRPVASRKRIRT